MNLPSGLEGDDGIKMGSFNWFWFVFGTVTIGSILLVALVYIAIQRRGWLITAVNFSVDGSHAKAL